MDSISVSSQAGYALVIAEKPDAAKRIAHALGRPESKRLNGVEYFEIIKGFDSNRYVVCSAAGHLYGLADPLKNRGIFPVFDVEWFPLDTIVAAKRTKLGRHRASNGYGVSKRIRLISSLARQASKFVQACDLDTEGEVIGYNIIKFGASREGLPILRAKFSTLTDGEIREAFSNLTQIEENYPRAGRMRHLLDFVWGVNVSRALTESYLSIRSDYNMFTMGRVQGPALGFVVERECEVNCHVPVPYWEIVCKLKKGEDIFEARYRTKRIPTLQEAKNIYQDVSKADSARVSQVSVSPLSSPPPCPFNLGDLQKEAFRIYKLAPSTSLAAAERLYLKAMISYPRTDSQKLPYSIGYSGILRKLSESSRFGLLVKELLAGAVSSRKPRQGPRDDPAHPAIYPTGENQSSNLEGLDSLVYELVLRRFLAAFAENAIIEETRAKFDIAGHEFESSGQKLMEKGWTRHYPYSNLDSGPTLPKLIEGESLRIVGKNLSEKRTEKPQRFTEGSLLAKLESENVGTKATRAEIISTLFTRKYLERATSIIPTETGLVLIEAMKKYCPEMTSPDMTRRMEKSIEAISSGNLSEVEFLGSTGRSLNLVLSQLIANQSKIGLELATSRRAPSTSKKRLRTYSGKKSSVSARMISVGKCPICKTGMLRAIRSPKTGKRFLGCSNYQSGCKMSAPLPRMGLIKGSGTACKTCGWPELDVVFSRKAGYSKPWRICVNVGCPSRDSAKGAVRESQ